ncbi:MAG: hypothetical protein J0I29_16145 [Rhizobiales bacterium]|nr:hypothetical protein [Hyphomicrobiales bacterium]
MTEAKADQASAAIKKLRLMSVWIFVCGGLLILYLQLLVFLPNILAENKPDNKIRRKRK